MDIKDYYINNCYDEMVSPDGSIREAYRELFEKIEQVSVSGLKQKQAAAENMFMKKGITFKVYSEENQRHEESIFPFDVVPRIIPNNEWSIIEKGLKQRVEALNLFIHDVYNDKKAIKDKIIPEKVVYSSEGYLKECEGLKPHKNIWCHISGIDLIKHNDGNYYILEDNLRIPFGVSYVLENREILKRTYPELFESLNVKFVSEYAYKLREMLQYISGMQDPLAVVLTPGMYNSAYFEHSFLAKQMGIELVEGCDLVCKNNIVYMKTTKGLKKVDVIYRRVDDIFMDPLTFNPSSVLGVPGIFNAYKNGNIAVANAFGTGVADDKVICSYVPDLIKYYLGEDAIINNVPTYLCGDKKQRDHVLSNLSNFVVKAANQSGGYGMLMGPSASKKELAEFAELIKKYPRKYIAQPVMSLSSVPTLIDDHLEGRHVDLRPFVICGEDTYVMPGGLTRVALKKGSLVVNSSQGGGSKDTWVVNRKGE